MKLQNLILEYHINQGNRLLESSCQGLLPEQSKIIRGIYQELTPLIEASLTQDQINQLFTGVEQQATAGGGNRTLIGQGKDVVKKADDIINNIGKWLQDTKPVQAFDQKFEDLKAKVAQKFPDLAEKTSALGEWVKANPGKSAAVIGILTALASLAGGPIGGAIAGQVLRGAQELLKGEKLSTAIGKGIKTAALGYLSGKAFEVIGKYVAGMRADSIPMPGAEQSGLSQVSYGATRTLTAPGFSSAETIQGFNVAAFPQEAEAINNAMGMISRGEAGGFDILKRVADEIRSPEYRNAIKDIMVNARADQLANDGLMQWINGIAQAGQALSQGAVAAASAGSSGKQPTKEHLTHSQINKLFYNIDRTSLVIGEGLGDMFKGLAGKAQQVGKNITTKITADKLQKAWKSAGSPTDSGEIAKILKSQGVDDSVTQKVFGDMGIELPASGTEEKSINTQEIIAKIRKLTPDQQKQILALLG